MRLTTKELFYLEYQQGQFVGLNIMDNGDDIDNIEQLDIISGLSFIKGFGVPHYNCLTPKEKKKINNILKDKNIKGWSIDDCVALVFSR